MRCSGVLIVLAALAATSQAKALAGNFDFARPLDVAIVLDGTDCHWLRTEVIWAESIVQELQRNTSAVRIAIPRIIGLQHQDPTFYSPNAVLDQLRRLVAACPFMTADPSSTIGLTMYDTVQDLQKQIPSNHAFAMVIFVRSADALPAAIYYMEVCLRNTMGIIAIEHAGVDASGLATGGGAVYSISDNHLATDVAGSLARVSNTAATIIAYCTTFTTWIPYTKASTTSISYIEASTTSIPYIEASSTTDEAVSTSMDYMSCEANIPFAIDASGALTPQQFQRQQDFIVNWLIPQVFVNAHWLDYWLNVFDLQWMTEGVAFGDLQKEVLKVNQSSTAMTSSFLAALQGLNFTNPAGDSYGYMVNSVVFVGSPLSNSELPQVKELIKWFTWRGNQLIVVTTNPYVDLTNYQKLTNIHLFQLGYPDITLESIRSAMVCGTAPTPALGR